MPIRSEFEGQGFTIQPVQGARAFVTNVAGELTGVVYEQPWTVGENTARCMKTSRLADEEANHQLVDCERNNGHGLYAYFDGSTTYRSHGRVEGVIEGYGEVVLGTRGFKATKAVIVALFVPSVVAKLRERYELMVARYEGIPFFDTFEEMVFWFPPNVGEKKDSDEAA